MAAGPREAPDPRAYVTITPVVDGNPQTTDDARADTSINAVPFKSQSLVSAGDFQLISYYNGDGFLVVGRRKLSQPKRWSLLHTRFTSRDLNDPHTTSSIGLDGNGLLHVAWGVHRHPLLYTRSSRSVLTDSPLYLNGSKEGNAGALTNEVPLQEAAVTYPEFWKVSRSGDLFLTYRTGDPGNGKYQLALWSNDLVRWQPIHAALNSGSSGPQPWIDNDFEGDDKPTVSAYINGLVSDSRGRLHTSWTWRARSGSPHDPSGVQLNHDLLYAYSDDGGRVWHTHEGRSYRRRDAHDIDESNAPSVIEIPQGSSLINRTGMAVSPQGAIYVASSWAPRASRGDHVRQYMLARFDGKRWTASQIGNRAPAPMAIGSETPTDQEQPSQSPVARPAVLIAPRGRVLVVFTGLQRGGGVTVAHSKSPKLADWRFVQLTDENLGTWEPTYDSRRWDRDGVLSMPYLRTGLGRTSDTLSVLEWDAGAYFESLDNEQAGGGNARTDRSPQGSRGLVASLAVGLVAALYLTGSLIRHRRS